MKILGSGGWSGGSWGGANHSARSFLAGNISSSLSSYPKSMKKRAMEEMPKPSACGEGQLGVE